MSGNDHVAVGALDGVIVIDAEDEGELPWGARVARGTKLSDFGIAYGVGRGHVVGPAHERGHDHDHECDHDYGGATRG